VGKTRSCNYSLEAPDDERKYRSKHVEQSRNNGIINFPTQLHLVGHFYKITHMECVTQIAFPRQQWLRYKHIVYLAI